MASCRAGDTAQPDRVPAKSRATTAPCMRARRGGSDRGRIEYARTKWEYRGGPDVKTMPMEGSMDRTLIANASIFDGSGAAPYAGDVMVEGQRIAAVQPGGGL